MFWDIIGAALHGIILAFGLILPLGVQNIFVFNQGSLQTPFVRALPSVITAAVCDTVLITVAILGLSVLLMENAVLKLIILCAGFLFLLYMGYAIWRQAFHLDNKTRHAFSWKKQVLFGASVSLLNPHAIIDTTMVIGTNSLAYVGMPKLVYAISCIAVSWVWFGGLALAGHNLHRIDKKGKMVKNINKIAALIIWAIAVYLLVDILELNVSAT